MDKGKITLYKPIKNSDEEEIKEVNYDFETLPSNAIATGQRFLMERNSPVISPNNDIELHNLLTCCAAGIEKEDGFRLHPKDKMKLATVSILFFNDASEDFQEENISES